MSVFNPLDSVSNKVYDKFTNIMKLTEYKGNFNGIRVTEENAVVLRGDCTISEGYNMASQVSSHPVYRAEDVTDSVRPADFVISLTSLSSDASMSYFDTLQSLSNSPLGGFTRNVINAFQDDDKDMFESRSQRVFAQLRKWWQEGTPLELDTVYDVNGFKDTSGKTSAFIITSCNIPRNKDIGSRAIKFTLQLKQIKFAEMEEVAMPLYSYSKGTTPSDITPSSNKTKEQDDTVKEGKDLLDQYNDNGGNLPNIFN